MIRLDGLREVEIGPLDDPLDEATRNAAAEALRAWIVDQDLEQSFVGGGTGFEVVRRTTGALREIVRAHPGQRGVVVGHVASLVRGVEFSVRPWFDDLGPAVAACRAVPCHQRR